MRRIVFCISLCSCALVLTGCALIGVVAHAMPPPPVPPKYMGLAHQSVGVMVWADRGVRIDWPNLQIDLANAIQKKLMEETKAKSMVGAKYDVQPASIVRYQRDHPQIDAQPITEVAPAIGVTRLVYIELEDFATRSDMSVDLFRGHAKATVRVVEVENGVAKIGFEHTGVEASYPPKGPREGVPSAGDLKIYTGEVDALATTIAHMFTGYQPEEWE